MTYHNVDPAAVFAVRELAEAIASHAKALDRLADTLQEQATPTEPKKPRCEQCGGDYPRDKWPGDQYDGHWDTCPNRPCGAPAHGGFCRLRRGHNMGQADVPENHRSSAE